MELPRFLILTSALAISIIGAGQLIAGENSDAVVEIHYHQRHFTPAKLDVAAGKAFTLRVINDSDERIEFESFKLNREKIVDAGHTLTLHFAPLSAGHYDFYDDFHQDVPEGDIVAH
jgi:hypothetical protein